MALNALCHQQHIPVTHTSHIYNLFTHTHTHTHHISTLPYKCASQKLQWIGVFGWADASAVCSLIEAKQDARCTQQDDSLRKSFWSRSGVGSHRAHSPTHTYNVTKHTHTLHGHSRELHISFLAPYAGPMRWLTLLREAQRDNTITSRNVYVVSGSGVCAVCDAFFVCTPHSVEHMCASAGRPARISCSIVRRGPQKWEIREVRSDSRRSFDWSDACSSTTTISIWLRLLPCLVACLYRIRIRFKTRRSLLRCLQVC